MKISSLGRKKKREKKRKRLVSINSLILDGLDKPTKKGPKDSPHRAIYDAEHIVDEGSLPGVLKRSEGEPKNKDKVVNEAYDNVGAVLEFYKDKFKWNSIDNKGSDVTSSVHFGESYENACRFCWSIMIIGEHVSLVKTIGTDLIV